MRKILTLLFNWLAGFVIILVGLTMMPSSLALFWVTFNAWLWLACPIILLYANSKEVEQ